MSPVGRISICGHQRKYPLQRCSPMTAGRPSLDPGGVDLFTGVSSAAWTQLLRGLTFYRATEQLQPSTPGSISSRYLPLG